MPSSRNSSTSSSDCSNPPPPEKCPWLVYTHRSHRRFTQTFFILSEGRCYNRSIPAMNDKYIYPCSHGWLLMLDMNNNLDDCFLLNPVSMEKIQLPPWIGFSMFTCNLSLPPNDPSCIVVAFSLKPEPCLRFCRPGDNKWTDQKLVLPDNGSSMYEFLVACGGNLYCFPRLSDDLMILDFDGSSIDIRPVGGVGEFSEETLPEGVRTSRCLVESCSELFTLKICYMGVTDKLSIRYIEVFRLDMEDLTWTRVESLGDRAFFVNKNGCTTSCSASAAQESGIKGNCIYLIEEQDKHLYRFDLEDTSLVVTLPFPERIKNWVDTLWMMPNAMDN